MIDTSKSSNLVLSPICGYNVRGLIDFELEKHLDFISDITSSRSLCINLKTHV